MGIFQETHHLEVSGKVDEPTATATNGGLKEPGASARRA